MIYTNPKIKLTHEDGWSYEIIAYEEETVVRYFEENSEGIEVEKGCERYTTFEGFDEKISDAIHKVRKMYKELNYANTI
jgi:hypothetical protein